MKALSKIFLFAALLGCTLTLTAPAHAAYITKKSMKRFGMMRPSFYWITLEPNDGKPRSKNVLDIHGNTIARVSPEFYKTLSMEGTGRLLSGKVINFHQFFPLPNGKKEIRWRFCGNDAPFGYGHGDIPLKPFRSVAVDPKVIPIGSVLFIPAAVGIPLPDESEHDGYFEAVDIGDMIVKNKVDIFTSFGDQRRVFEENGIETGKEIEVYLVQ